MDSFGGGLGAHGEVCGAVIGGLAAIGLLFGRDTGGSQPDVKMWIYSREFLKRFQNEIAGGTLICRDIAKVDWMDPNQVKDYRKGDKIALCRSLTGQTACLIGELIERARP